MFTFRSLYPLNLLDSKTTGIPSPVWTVNFLCQESNPVHEIRNQSLYSETNLNVCVLCGAVATLTVSVL
jgi:hypothetical protein